MPPLPYLCLGLLTLIDHVRLHAHQALDSVVLTELLNPETLGGLLRVIRQGVDVASVSRYEA